MNRIQGFGIALRHFRKAQGFTQEALAEKATLHVNSVSLIERGLVPPALDTICAFADALGVPASDLVLEMERQMSGAKAKSSQKA